MKDYQKIFLNLALDVKALEFGNFTLKSGRTSPYFFNAAKMLSGNLSELANCYVEAIHETEVDFDSIYGPAYKGIFLGSMVALILSQHGKHYPLSFDRKEIKDHGEGGNIIGNNPNGNVMIIEGIPGFPPSFLKNPKRAFCWRLSLILITRLPCPQRAIVSPKSTSRL